MTTDPALRALECEHRRATPCVDRNGSCGTHLSPWAAAEAAPLDVKDETNLIRIRYQKVYVLGHPMADVIAWKAFYDAHRTDPNVP